jgi:hypothetical protein
LIENRIGLEVPEPASLPQDDKAHGDEEEELA